MNEWMKEWQSHYSVVRGIKLSDEWHYEMRRALGMFVSFFLNFRETLEAIGYNI